MKPPVKLLTFSFLIILLSLYIGEVVGETLYYLNKPNAALVEHQIEGPEAVCLNSAFVFEEYSTSGAPGDTFFWSMRDETGFEISNQRGATVSIPYTSEGNFTITLRVARGENPNFDTKSINVLVERGPTFILPPDVILCGSENVSLTALDPDDPQLGNVTIEWFDEAGNAVGTGNTILTNIKGRYQVTITSAACSIDGFTFVGPSIEVELNQTENNVCLGQNVTFTPDVPVNGMWAYQKSDQLVRTEIGEFFELTLDTDALDGPGEYTIYFSVEDRERPGCSVEEQRNLTVTEAVNLIISDITNAESCDNPNGSFKINGGTGLQSIQVFGPQGSIFNDGPIADDTFVENLWPGIYTVIAESTGCITSTTVSIDNLNPDDAVPFTVSPNDQTCSDTGINPGMVTITLEEFSPDMNVSLINVAGGAIRASFVNEPVVTLNAPAGDYLIEVSDADNCVSISSQPYSVGGAAQVNFSIPPSIRACESYNLLPISTQSLQYTLTGPNGQNIPFENGGFTLTTSGTYEILGFSQDSDSPLCPNLKVFEVEINEQIEFEYSMRQIDCLGNQLYTAELNDLDPSTVFIRWLDSDQSTILGRDLVFFPTENKTYYLDVQPRASSQCPAAPIPFEVMSVQTSVDVVIEGSPFCGLNDPLTTLSVNTDFDAVESIEWYYIDEDGFSLLLNNPGNQATIDVPFEGTYEVVVRSDIYCELGRATYDVGRILDIRLGISAKQFICIEENQYNTLNPGEFEIYEWSRDGNVISTDPIFTPRAPGQYGLYIVDFNGCEVSTTFEVEDICAQLISMPNAMVSGDPERDFRIFANPAISEIEVFVFNKLGELIYYCQSPNNPNSDAICIWDGFVNGTKLMVGTYPVTIKYKIPGTTLSDQVNKFIVVPK
ncbi:hypothetical protein [Anditalea andensis]|uniref:PKD domain-containing protein n=1 Tax=Anditalea andensis TaxID=1048983 RepID=A0A074L5N3_9BACT|nr:hypothetical protein [Anditalea andensis]KEO75113.1 hypothetical protein EL17_05425 [Anditalea andensis]